MTQRIRWAALVVGISSCRGSQVSETASTAVPPITGDPCPIDFDVARADAWPGCPEGGPFGIERTYFMIGAKPCRIDQRINDVARGSYVLAWGPGGRLERLKYANHVTTNHYDAGGQLVSTDDVDPPDRRTIKYERDARGQLVTVDDGATRTVYTRDASGSITAVDRVHGADHVRETIRYSNGVAVAAESVTDYGGKHWTMTSSVERDSSGRRTRSLHETRGDEGAGMKNDIKFSYDARGALASMSWVTDLGDKPDETVMMATYDSLGRITTLVENAFTYRFAYDCR